MLFLASAITLAVFIGIGFPNPDQAWVRTLKDDRETTVRGGMRYLELDLVGALVGEPTVRMAGRNVLEPRGIGAARMRYSSFGLWFGLGQGRSQEEAGAAGART